MPKLRISPWIYAARPMKEEPRINIKDLDMDAINLVGGEVVAKVDHLDMKIVGSLKEEFDAKVEDFFMNALSQMRGKVSAKVDYLDVETIGSSKEEHDAKVENLPMDVVGLLGEEPSHCQG